MTRRFIVRPLAEADLEDAAKWYEEEGPGLSERFLSDRTFAASANDLLSSRLYPAMSVAHCCTRSRTLSTSGRQTRQSSCWLSCT
jgi:plasmid stabilization system protein ParE